VTIIHGECTPHNVIARDGEVYVIDWESAAIAPGEIDLVSLVEGWPRHEQAAAIKAYVQHRWPDDQQTDMEARLDAARIYWALRWLGERPDWTVRPKNRWRFDELRNSGKRLGLV
jgi:thiamine kinase-like enzyme